MQSGRDFIRRAGRFVEPPCTIATVADPISELGNRCLSRFSIRSRKRRGGYYGATAKESKRTYHETARLVRYTGIWPLYKCFRIGYCRLREFCS